MNNTILPIKLFIQQYKNVSTDNIAVIMCTSYNVNTSDIDGINKKLILYFDDTLSIGKNSFTMEIANQIKSFVDMLSYESLYVCCDSGESRSSAIAASILKYKNEKNLYIWDNPHYHPNALVYDIMCQCFGKRTPGIVIRYLTWRNKNALHNTIKRKKKNHSKRLCD